MIRCPTLDATLIVCDLLLVAQRIYLITIVRKSHAVFVPGFPDERDGRRLRVVQGYERGVPDEVVETRNCYKADVEKLKEEHVG